MRQPILPFRVRVNHGNHPESRYKSQELCHEWLKECANGDWNLDAVPYNGLWYVTYCFELKDDAMRFKMAQV